MLHAELSLVCNFMDHTGRIIASSERARIGQVHPRALRIMRGELGECSVSSEEAAHSDVMLEGMLTPIDINGERLTCFTMAGPLPVVRPLVRIVRFCVISLLQTAQAGHPRHPLPPPPAAAPAANLSELLHHATTTVSFSLARLHQAIEHIDEGVSLFDENLRLVVWNQRYLELAGWPGERSCRGQTMQAMVLHFLNRAGIDDAQVRQRLQERVQRLREGKNNDFQFETPDGQIIAVADRPLPGGGAVSSYTDITEHHRALLALRTAREDAENLVRERTQTLDTYTRLSSDWFWESDEEFRITHVYGDIYTKLRITPGYFMAKRRWEHPLLGVSKEQLAEHIAQHERHETFRNFEYGLVAPDGSTSYLSVSGAPRFDAQGRFLGYHGTGMDITQRRRTQRLLQERTAALERANAEMERQVRERTEALRGQLSFLRQLLEAIPTPIFYKDTQARYLGANPAFELVLGKPIEQVIGKRLEEVEPNILTAYNATADRELLSEPGRRSYEGTVHYGDGSVHQVQFHKATFTDLDGKVGGIVGVMIDITERKRLEDELRLNATVFDNSSEGMAVLRADGTVLTINQAFTTISGHTRDDAVGHPMPLLEDHDKSGGFFIRMKQHVDRDGSWQGEAPGQRKGGEIYPTWLSVAAVRDSLGAPTHYVVAFSDLSQKKQNEERIQQLAFNDPLTGLPNRRLLGDRLEHALVSGLRNRTGGAVLLIDVDNFKALNDTRGHDVGDLLLKQIGQRLASCVHEGDTVARMSGDEFVVLVEGLSIQTTQLVSEIKTLGTRLLRTLEQPYELAGQSHHHSASMGVALFGATPTSVAQLLKQADMAMYRAKASGRNTLSFFDPQMQSAVDARTALERAMRDGLQRGEFLPYYQPQIDQTGAVIGVEALVRWRKPDGSLVAPGEFIALAEETGLIVPLGQHMLEAACHQLTTWARTHATAGLSIAVNVSARQFHHADFVQQVLGILRATGAPATRLKLEITESLLIENIEAVIEKMQALKNHGVGFSLDDFGTGYSSLAYLKRLPLDQLKIDQSFVRDVLVDGNDAAIARMVVALADSLGLQAIAEGVETPEQQAFLLENGCRTYQGYLFSRPLPIEALQRWLDDRTEPARPARRITAV